MLVGIKGVGTVGGAVAEVLEGLGHVVRRDDPDKGYADDLEGCDIIFVCVWDSGDMKNLKLAVAEVVNLSPCIVVKTTLRPGTMSELVQAHNKPLIYNPEFLCELSAIQDFQYQDKVVIGTWHPDATWPLLELLKPLSENFFIVDPPTAELVKLVLNSFYALKVTFANEVYDACERLGADYESLRVVMEADRFVSPNHLDVWHGGYRGYGGKCLPKDVQMFLDVHTSLLLWVAEGLNTERYANTGAHHL
jgi:UDPglucose 6-dehydrogenase